MRKLILILFVSSILFACSEEAEEMMDKAGETMDDAVEATKEMAEDVTDSAEQMMDDKDEIKGPALEPLPDWDSLPPIEEEMAKQGDEQIKKE